MSYTPKNGKLIQLNLPLHIVELLDKLQEVTGRRNRTDTIIHSIEVAWMIVEAQLQERKVTIETKDGEVKSIVVPGLRAGKEIHI